MTQRNRAISMAMVWLNLALAFVAYRSLLTLRVYHGLTLEVESWMFVADDASPVLIVGMSTWLLVRRWRRIRSLPLQGGAALIVGGCALALLALGVAAWSFYTSSPDMLAVSGLCMGLAVALLLRGTKGARAALLPACFLLFALRIPGPILNELAFQLQLWTAEYAGILMFSLGLPALVSADQILRADQAFQVIETCNGLRSMETLSMLAVLMNDLFQRRGWHAALVFLSAPFVAFMLNGVRVVLLIVNPHSEIATIHTLQGVGILLGGLIVLYLMDGGFEKVGEAIRSRREARIGSGLVPNPRDVPNPGEDGARGSGAVGAAQAGRFWRPTLVAGLLASVLLISLMVPNYNAPVPDGGAIFWHIPMQIGTWEGVELPKDVNFMGSIAMRESVLRSYQHAGSPSEIELYVGLGNHSRATRGPLSPKTRVPGSGWITEETRHITLGDPGIAVEERVVRSNARRRLVYHWIEGSDGFADEVRRSLLGLDQSPWHRRRSSVVVRMSTALDGIGLESRERAEARLKRFYLKMRQSLDALDQQLTRKRFSGFS